MASQSGSPVKGAALRRPVSRFLTLSALFMIAACSSVPDAINPSAWVDAATGDETEQTAEAPPGADESFPTLGRVDRQVDAATGGLSADTEGRQYADGIQRQGSSGNQNDQPPPAPAVEAPAPSPQPVTPVAEAAPPTAPATPQPQSQQATPTVSGEGATTQQPTTSTQAAQATTYGVDEDMRGRLARQLAEIRARAADQGSLLPPDLTSGDEGVPTVIVSSDGIETATSSGLGVSAPLGGAQGVVQGGIPGAVQNQGALPLPSNATKVATILFRNGSSQLDARDRQILSDVARLQKQSNGVLRVIGHASQRTQNMDIARHKDTNLRMSASRAQQVASALQGMGVNGSNILLAAVGDNQPVYLEVMPSGEAGNRRTEIYLSN